MEPSILTGWSPPPLVKWLCSTPRYLSEVLRALGNQETSRLAIIGALFWFLVFGGIWLLFLAEIVAFWLGIPFELMAEELGPITFGDFVVSTFFAWLMIFMIGNFLYGRFFMSREETESVMLNWPERIHGALLLSMASKSPYSWSGFRFFLKLSAGICFLIISIVVFLFFVKLLFGACGLPFSSCGGF